MGIIIRSVSPDNSISDFVQSLWMLENTSENNAEVTILPDGIIDMFLYKSANKPFSILLRGIDTEAHQSVIEAKTKIFAVGFKLPATEYLLHNTVSDIVNYGQAVTDPMWHFEENVLDDFELFCQNATQKIKDALTTNIDARKQELFRLIYSSNGALAVKELSEKVYWAPRQINRYFTTQFGISLKAYCNILRFRASLGHIAEGKLFPEQNFFDHAHFIREVKKLAGVLPKELKENKNDRFIQFSVLPRQ